jgi:hypothetical protein
MNSGKSNKVNGKESWFLKKEGHRQDIWKIRSNRYLWYIGVKTKYKKNTVEGGTTGGTTALVYY